MLKVIAVLKKNYYLNSRMLKICNIAVAHNDVYRVDNYSIAVSESHLLVTFMFNYQSVFRFLMS